MLLWFCITEEARGGLLELQDLLYPCMRLTLPSDKERDITLSCKLEDVEGIGKIIAQAPSRSRGRKDD